MARDSREFQALLRVHEGLPRQGPGSAEATELALSLLPPLRRQAKIYDLGCGPGLATIVLAKKLQRKIIAVDLTPEFIEQTSTNAEEKGLSHLIEPRHGDMIELDDQPESIDLIWSEGAIYCVGFDNALHTWRPLLHSSGIVACTELSWLTSTPSSKALEFWQAAYPAMRSVKENILRAEQLGYARINHFTLPDSCWWDEYYSPLLHNTERLASESKDDPVLARAVANARAEISLFHECSREYGYVFYLLQKSDITIERAQIDDSQDIARVLRTSFSAALPFISILHTRYEDFNYVRDQLFPTNQIFVARDAGCNVIGYIAFNDERINHLYIDPAATRQGTGTRLLNIAKLHNCKLRLWTFQKNENAQRFYQARGFYPIKETDGSGNEEHEPDILYEWKADLYR